MKYCISAPKVLIHDIKKCNENEIVYIEIENGIITNIGNLSDLSVKEQNECYHYKNCTILPGLINAHEHLATKSKYTPWTMEEIKSESYLCKLYELVEMPKGFYMRELQLLENVVGEIILI